MLIENMCIKTNVQHTMHLDIDSYVKEGIALRTVQIEHLIFIIGPKRKMEIQGPFQYESK